MQTDEAERGGRNQGVTQKRLSILLEFGNTLIDNMLCGYYNAMVFCVCSTSLWLYGKYLVA